VRSFGRRTVALAKRLIWLSGAAMALFLAAVIGWQATLCVWAEQCETLSTARLFEAAGVGVSRTYFTASVDSHRPYRVELMDFTEQLLDAPASVPLLLAIMMLALFYVWVRLIEMGLDRS